MCVCVCVCVYTDWHLVVLCGGGAVLLYLAILGLQDIGFQAFQRIVLSQHTTKMTQFLRFLFDDEDAIMCVA